VLGQPFTVVLTCAVVETASTRVVPDQSRLDASVIQLPPFDVIDGKRAEDLRTVGQRFIQYEYTLRLLAEQAFARDVAVPPLSVSYRIETQTGQGTASQGREQTYELPALPMRSASLVPNDSRDIREAAPMTLGDIESRAFRANAMRVAAMVVFALGGLVLLAGLLRAARSPRTGAEARRALDEAAISRGAGQALLDVRRQQRQGGWTPELLSRALATLRIVASLATGRAVAQRTLPRGAMPVEGEITLNGRFSRASVAISGSATAPSMAQAPSGADSSLLNEVAAAIARLDRARYGRESAADPDVDGALESGMRLAQRLAWQHGWLGTRQAALARALERWRPGA
jgi:hypothetical protein